MNSQGKIVPILISITAFVITLINILRRKKKIREFLIIITVLVVLNLLATLWMIEQ